MDDAAMWSIMGTGLATVFLCLISLILMVSVLRVLLDWYEKRKAGPAPVVPQAAAARDESVASDEKLIAVLAAAVSAASGMPVSSFRIASVKPSSSATPAWGIADRIPGDFQRNRR